MRLFISYSHNDNSFVEKLATDIEVAGIDCWLDVWEMRVGDSLRKRIEEAISSSDWLAVVLSQHSVKSAWVDHELGMGFVRELDSRHVFILPIVLDSSIIPLSLRDKFFADFRYDYDFGFHALLQKLLDLDSETLAHARRLKRHYTRCDEQIPLLCSSIEVFFKTGLSLHQTFKEITHLLPNPLGEEFARVVNEADNEDCSHILELLLERIPTYRMQLFVRSLLSTRKYGGTLDLVTRSDIFRSVEAGQMLNSQQSRAMRRDDVK